MTGPRQEKDLPGVCGDEKAPIRRQRDCCYVRGMARKLIANQQMRVSIPKLNLPVLPSGEDKTPIRCCAHGGKRLATRGFHASFEFVGLPEGLAGWRPRKGFL